MNSLLDNLGDDIDKNDPEIKKLLEKKDKKGDNNDGKNWLICNYLYKNLIYV